MAQRKYDDKLKQNVINAVLIGDRSAAQVARDYRTANQCHVCLLYKKDIHFYP